MFSLYESEFARHVFHPLAANAALSAKYGAWLRKFAASVCWRIIEECVANNTLGPISGRRAPELASCRETWRRYLIGKLPDVGGHHLHFLPWNTVIGGEGAGARNGAHLSLHAIEKGVICRDHAAFVYAKLGPVILIGLIADSAPKSWRGTRINAEGKLKPRDVSVPDQYRDLIISGARSS